MSDRRLLDRIVRAGLAAFLAFVCLGTMPAAAQSRPNQIIVLFDQAENEGSPAARVAARAWLQTFADTFSGQYSFVVAGFDERTKVIATGTLSEPADRRYFKRRLERLPAQGGVTDFEAAFRYLVESVDAERVAMVAVVGDGRSGLWDSRQNAPAAQTKVDPRYRELDQQYRSLKDAQATPQELQEYLAPYYLDRNAELVRALLPALKQKLGERLVVWDVSGRHPFLKQWTDILGAQYLRHSLTGDGDAAAASMGQALASLQGRAAMLVGEPLPPDHAERLKAVVAELAGGAALTEKPALGEARRTGSTSGGGSVLLPALVSASVVVVLAGGAWFWLRNRGLGGGKARKAPSAPGGKSRRRRMPSLFRPKPQDPYVALEQVLQRRMSEMDRDAREIRSTLLEQEASVLAVEPHPEFAVPAPAGAMRVSWTDGAGQSHVAEGVGLTMSGPVFRTGDGNAVSIQRVDCPRLGIEFEILAAELQERQDGTTLAVIRQFAKGVDDRMAMIDLLTRIEGG